MDAKIKNDQVNPQIEKTSDPLFAESVRKGFVVLEALNRMQQPMTLAEIADEGGLGRSATQRFVHTLRELGFLKQDAKTKSYTLSPKILSYARTFFSSSALCSRAEPFLRELASDTGETVNLSELDGADIVYTIRFPSIHSVSVNLSIGARLPVYNTASGRAILSTMPEKQAHTLFSLCDRVKWTSNTKTAMEDLRKELIFIKKAGYSLSDQEAFLGDISIAAPIIGFDGVSISAVNIAVPTPRWSKERVLDELMPKVVHTPVLVSREFGSK